MKPLTWKTAPQRIRDRAAGLLALLLILFSLHLVKPAPYRLGAVTPPCEHPVFVQIEGEIRHPGLYSFGAPPALDELIRKAGGLRGRDLPPPDRRLIPNSRIIMTKEGGALKVDLQEISSFHKMTLGLPISVNTESEEGFTALPGVGKNTAKAIVEERAKRGGFKSLEEIMGIPGIGPKFYARMKPYLTL